ncbi:MAG: cation:proton antiporter [Anaerolineales bacterium]|nr:cation:proton antiporter [Anaerolineales bacterium]
MTPFLQFILFLSLLLTLAKLGGYISTRLGQPVVLGELLVGLALGPSLINIFHISIFENIVLEEIISDLAQIGVLLLMFVAGLELHFTELVRNMKVSALAGIFGVLTPLGLGYLIGLAFGFEPVPAFYLGLTLGATSVSISAQTLMELKMLRSRVGLGLLGAAVFDDIFVILLLSSFLAFTGSQGEIATIAWVFARMVIFLGISLLFGIWALPWLARRVSRLPISQGVVTLALVVMLLYSFAGELVGGMAAITGAFLAGLMFARSPEKERLERGINAVSYGFFVPIFFAHIGLSVNLRGLDSGIVWLFLGISAVAILGKLIGAGLGARLAQFSWRESAQLGVGMISRGEVGLILASVGMSERLISEAKFSAIVGMIVVSTLVTPPLLRSLFSVEKSKLEAEDGNLLEEEIS